MTPTTKTVLYVRVSTAEQTSEHQLVQARDAGFQIADEHVITDHGVSGISVRLADRDQGRRLFDLLQPGDKLLVRWVDRLGRNYEDVKEIIETFNKRGVTVCTVINRMIFEADFKLTDPTMKAARAAILAFMSALAEADATAKKEARQAGIIHAKASADADRKYRGKKPSFNRAVFDTVQTMLAHKAHTVSQIARETSLSRQAVHRIRDKAGAADAALRRWSM
jgi:putative DNA-invertase from lambdoid prophage Rac